MKIKDLPTGANLNMLHVKISKESLNKNPNINSMCPEGYWISQWGYENGKAGVWLRKELNESRIYPICIDSLTECLEWEIIL